MKLSVLIFPCNNLNFSIFFQKLFLILEFEDIPYMLF